MPLTVVPARQVLRKLGLSRGQAAAARMHVERTILSRAPRIRSARAGRILCYHSIGTPAWGVNDVDPGQFRHHLEVALDGGYRFVPAERIATGTARPMDLAITFDDGLASVARNAAPILAEFGVPWTMFVVTDWADGNHTFGPDVVLGWNDLAALARVGVTIGSHSVSHRNFRILRAAEVRRELVESADRIEERLGLRPTSFAIPYGQRRDWPEAGRVAAALAGYRHVFAQAEDRRPADTVGRTFITRFDNERVFSAALRGAFEHWEEWY